MKLSFLQEEPIEVRIDYVDIIDFSISIAITYWYVLTKNWIASNIFGLAFSIQGIAMLSLGSYKVGCILLGGLFVYDIFWVFGTDVMVTVAKSFDAPIKLLFPKNIFAAEFTFSMLGLGDIVIPGMFIALLLRFDLHQNLKNKISTNSAPYFRTCFLFYIIGLITTIFVMHTFQAAQPALLYLVPACIGSSFGLAMLRGEISQLFEYSEEKKEEKKEETNKKEN